MGVANASRRRAAEVLLRAGGGSAALFLLPAAAAGVNDANEVGATATTWQQAEVGPCLLRHVRTGMTAGKQPVYELLVSAAGVEEYVRTAKLMDARAFFELCAQVTFAGLAYGLANWSASTVFGEPCLYRVLLRVADGKSAPHVVA